MSGAAGGGTRPAGEPTSGPDGGAGAPARPWRLAVLWIAGLKTAGLAILAVILLGASGQDPAGRAMGGGFVAFAFAYWLLLVLPPALLARKGRHLGFALALLVVPEPILALLSLVL